MADFPTQLAAEFLASKADVEDAMQDARDAQERAAMATSRHSELSFRWRSAVDDYAVKLLKERQA